MRSWSKYQKAIFSFVESGKGNAIVVAVAGSGKTTTIVDAVSRTQGSSIFLAFNKFIASELITRGVNARTFHSLTYGAVTSFKSTRQVHSDKLRMLVRKHFSGRDNEIYGSFTIKLVGLARQAGIDHLVPNVQSSWMNLVSYHDLEIENEQGVLQRGLELASDLLAYSNESPMVDFDDLLYLAVKEDLSLPKFDMVFVDEAQDTNAIQRSLLHKILHPSSRIIAVGDPAQAIYGFRGADSDSMDLIKKEFKCVELPLTVSYRCPRAVVKYAAQWVDHIEAAPRAPEGVVVELGTTWDLESFEAKDLILCRTTKPLVALGFRLLRRGIPARILGKEIGDGLRALVERQRADTTDQLRIKLAIWAEHEAFTARAKGDDSKAEVVYDKVEALYCLIDGLSENQRTIPALLNAIESLFNDNANAVTLATIHKAKGLEAPTVYWLNRSQCPQKWVSRDWQLKQEENLCYVAATRAQERLILIEDGKTKASRHDFSGSPGDLDSWS